MTTVFDNDKFRLDLQTLTQRFRQEGMFTPSTALGLFQLLAVTVCWLLCMACLMLGHPGTALLPMALGYSLAAWMGHDVAHFQVVKIRSRWYNPLVTFLVATSGLSMRWWQVRHTRHHAHTNEYMRHNNGRIDFLDEDLHGMPFVCWDAAATTEKERNRRGLQTWIKTQPYTLWPLLGLGYLSMVFNSFRVARPWELATMLVHHIGVITAFAWASSSIGVGIALWFLGHVVTGVYMGTLFIWSHTGRARRNVLSKKACSGLNIIASTRNVRLPRWFETSLAGGMGFQIEHHLFPTMPRHRFAMASPHVRTLLNAHGVEYCEESVLQALRSIQATLRTEAQAFLNGPCPTNEFQDDLIASDSSHASS